MQQYDGLIIGGGAAGLMCAAAAGHRGKRMLVLEHTKKVGKKILMSGGGRCNFTNYEVEPSHFISRNPHFCVSALKRYTPYDFLSLVQKYDLAFHEKTLGQLFCDRSSKDILAVLLAECEAAGVDIRTQCEVESIEYNEDQTDTRFQLTTSTGRVAAPSLVVATGGLSIPTMGATGFGYQVAGQFDLKVERRDASLVPFTLSGDLLALAQSLAGVAVPVSVSCGDTRFREAMLFTHKGLSGPAMLQISNYWMPGEAIEIDFLPDVAIADCLAQWRTEGRKGELKNALALLLPKRFVQAWLDHDPAVRALGSTTLANLSKADTEALGQVLHRWRLMPAGTEGYRTAEVTRGGISTDEVSSKTFEAKSVPGLYFIGEVLDVTGWLGGYNFQWAWASGHCAAQYL
ncbi:NAD(P)/FAD-dependent oxidoreductase [Saccharospirillum impatiens]|uniref:NAD(P)/FAD-dependent oxidoreductase n=1 Tax=Saccharospirillum impatiens TaxID=169438 RepID=UPI00040601AB|nr:NAD(P)/FAD-dependent oxidoreductase [Saccharospirillum impatiens]